MTKNKTNIEEIIENILQKFYKEMAYQDGSDPTGSTWCMSYESADRVWDWFENELLSGLNGAYKLGYNAFDKDNDDKYLPKDQVQAECEKYLDEFVAWYNSDENEIDIEHKGILDMFKQLKKEQVDI